VLGLCALGAAAQTTPLTGASQVTGGGSHSCAVCRGAAKCWGNNNPWPGGRQLDRRTARARFRFSALSSGVTAIAAGGQHTCALVNGGVKCWGTNGSGQLGDSSNTQRLIPVDVTGLTSGVTAISAGAAHTCALTTGGGLKCWGFNSNGQLGDNSNSNRNVPVDVVGLTSGVTSVAAGYFHTCAVASGGAVKCWGDNFVGELGNNSSDESHVPVDVSGLGSGASKVAVGTSHSCALMISGGVKCWGINFNGQLGDGGVDPIRRIPGDVVGLTGVAALSSNGKLCMCADRCRRHKVLGKQRRRPESATTRTPSETPRRRQRPDVRCASVATGDLTLCAAQFHGRDVLGKQSRQAVWAIRRQRQQGAGQCRDTDAAGRTRRTDDRHCDGRLPEGHRHLYSPGQQRRQCDHRIHRSVFSRRRCRFQRGHTGTSHEVTGLSPCTAYTFTVTATNVNGTGPPSAASNSVTPTGPGLS
jgi:hypothetical protein